MRSITLLLLLFINVLPHIYAQTGNTDDEKAILKVVQQFFDAMEAKDTVLFANTALASGYHYSVRGSNDSVSVGFRSHARFNQGLATSRSVVRERLRNTGVNIQVHKRIATVWGPYDLWVDNKFSHCGVDVFTLIKTKEGWKIATIAYTVEQEECDKEIK